MSKLQKMRERDVDRYTNYGNFGSIALSELSTFVGLPGLVLTYGFPDMFRWLAKHKRAAKAISIALAILLMLPHFVQRLLGVLQYVMSYFAASVLITKEDILYSYLVRWMWRKTNFAPQSSAAGQSIEYLNDYTDFATRVFKQDEDSYLNRQEIAFLSQDRIAIFRHDGRLFWMVRQGFDYDWESGRSADRTRSVRLWCFGRSTKPIETLVEEAVASYKNEVEAGCTSVYVNKDAASWRWAGTKTRRPIDSVDLDPGLKDPLMQDIEQFFHPGTKGWYKRRGVPYRRGYLFHGVPGTGKSSLAFAMAGKFAMDIYAVSLLDRSLHDNDLPALFSDIGNNTLLLLEDIDSAGLTRESQAGDDGQEDGKKESADSSGKSDAKKSTSANRSNVTLSGLLNAIDGVIAPEGHILIMTSNRPETLDPALVRAGRVDVSVEFTLASKAQAESIFRRMYAADDQEDEAISKLALRSHEDLALMAERFAAKIPEKLFSPADIQDYMIVRRSQPQRAIDDADDWIRDKQKVIEDEAQKKTDATKKSLSSSAVSLYGVATKTLDLLKIWT